VPQLAANNAQETVQGNKSAPLVCQTSESPMLAVEKRQWADTSFCFNQ
jgi:hypothetical protein